MPSCCFFLFVCLLFSWRDFVVFLLDCCCVLAMVSCVFAALLLLCYYVVLVELCCDLIALLLCSCCFLVVVLLWSCRGRADLQPSSRCVIHALCCIIVVPLLRS